MVDRKAIQKKFAAIEGEMGEVRTLWLICNGVVFGYIIFLMLLVLYQRGIFNRCCKKKSSNNEAKKTVKTEIKADDKLKAYENNLEEKLNSDNNDNDDELNG